MVGVIVMQGMYGTQPDLPLSKSEPEPASTSSIGFDSFRLHLFRFTDDFLLLFSDIGSERRAEIVGDSQLFFLAQLSLALSLLLANN